MDEFCEYARERACEIHGDDRGEHEPDGLGEHKGQPCLNGRVRVTEAETLDMETYGQSKIVARLNTALSAAPALELVQSDGTPLADDGKWRLILAEGGKALRFGPLVGTRILVK